LKPRASIGRKLTVRGRRDSRIALNADFESQDPVPLEKQFSALPFHKLSEIDKRIYHERKLVARKYLMQEKEKILKLFKIGLLVKL
jgi:hypothetical protein